MNKLKSIIRESLEFMLYLAIAYILISIALIQAGL